jgi:N6-adenosine-specific RNA methylase IME4
MELEALKELPVADLAADDCVLFMWALDSMLPQALELIEAWDFKYKTVGFYWVKEKFFGMGYWTRANPEQCLLATRGKPKRLSAGVRKLVNSPRREHSRKPDEVRDRITQLVSGPYVELFARGTAQFWDTEFSDQATLFDQGHVETRRQPSSLVDA